MSNLGYFQLKANPGVWYLNLKNGTRSDLVYQLSHQGEIVIDSFVGSTRSLTVDKKYVFIYLS